MNSTVLQAIRRVAPDAWVVLAGLLALYAPTYVMLARGPWQRDEYTHGPFVVAAFLWLLWQKRRVILSPAAPASPVAGSIALGFGLLLYISGHALDIIMFEAGSQIFVLAGLSLLYLGRPGLLSLLFPLLFLGFMVPLPSLILDTLTGPLKLAVSAATAKLVASVGYPIDREGVVITIGSHQLLVADACSGLKSMYALAAAGAFYIYHERQGRLHDWGLAALLLPIAFIANVIRVIILSLVSYHLGEEAAQGFLHDFSGITVFVAAVLMMFAAGSALEKIAKKTAQDSPPRP